MRRLTGILTTAAIPGAAFAHELPDGTPPVEQALHHALSLHHLPALLLLVVVLAFLWRASSRRAE